MIVATLEDLKKSRTIAREKGWEMLLYGKLANGKGATP